MAAARSPGRTILVGHLNGMIDLNQTCGHAVRARDVPGDSSIASAGAPLAGCSMRLPPLITARAGSRP